jgi:predicted acyl esterase
MLANLSCPRLGLIGPWAHMYPHQALPGPAVGFLQEALRWWGHWLKGEDTGIVREPMLRAFCGEALPAKPYYETAPGRWITEATWPSSNVVPQAWGLARGRLQEGESASVSLTWRSPQATGLAGGEWCPYGTGGRGPEFPGDQREDDGKSLVFDTEPLSHDLVILGAAKLELELSVDKPLAFVVARLCDVAFDGASTRVSYGALNLCHRDSHEKPALLIPGKRYRVTLQLNEAAYRFRADHQIRLALSTTYWPLIWPSPEAVTLTVHCARSSLSLPLRAAGAEAAVSFAAPESGPPANHTQLQPVHWEQKLTHDVLTGETVFSAERNEGLKRLENNGLEIGTSMTERLSIREDDPISAETVMTRVYEIGRGDWRTKIEARTRLTATATAFNLASRIHAYEGDTMVFEKEWTRTIPRGFV